MSTEDGEAAHTPDQGRPGDGDEDGDAAEEGQSCGGHDDAEHFPGEDGSVGGGSCKAQAGHSNCSSETCIPTPSCRICFQGAEQVRDALLCSGVRGGVVVVVVGGGTAPCCTLIGSQGAEGSVHAVAELNGRIQTGAGDRQGPLRVPA